MTMDADVQGDPPRTSTEWRRGWPTVLTAALGYGAGGSMILLVAGLFIAPMRDSLGWSATAVTIAPIITLVWAFSYPLAGWAIDRLGSRRVAIGGAIGLAISVAALAVVPINGVTLYGIAALIGLFAAVTSVPTYTRAVATWFRSGVGLAFGITLSGSALISLLATPLAGTVIAGYGWRAGYLVVAGIILVIGLPAVLLGFRERTDVEAAGPATATVASGTALREAVRDLRFWCYVGSFTIGCVAIGGFVGHLQPMLAEKGFPLAVALTFGVVYAWSVTLGKVLIGTLLDRFRPFTVGAAVLAVGGLGAIGLTGSDPTTAIVLVGITVLAIGLGQGAEADFIAFFTLHSFGVRTFATLVGVLGMLGNIGLSVGAFLFARLYDSFGDYDLAGWVGAACLFVAGAVLLLAGVVSRRRDRAATPD